MKIKKKKPKWYSVLIVPEGQATMKRYKVTRQLPKVIGVFALLWITLTFVLGGAAYYYRSGWLSTADVRVQNEQMIATQSRVNEKLASMEESVGRASRLATQLESVIGIGKKTLTKSIGPISEDNELPDAKKLSLLQKTNNIDVGFDGLELKMDELNQVVASVEMRLQGVYEYHQDKLAYWASIPSIWPVRGWVTSEFGHRRSPRGIGSTFHEGIDVSAPSGTPIYASGNGVVTFAGIKRGLGKTVVIDHGFGVTTVYGHSSQLFVREGDKVKRGSEIAAVGRTGRSTGPHLHYQVVVDGVPVDPMRYIIENF